MSNANGFMQHDRKDNFGQLLLSIYIAAVSLCSLMPKAWAQTAERKCPEDKACILVIKPAKMPLIGSFPVYDEKFVLMGELSGKSYVHWEIEPGEHSFNVFARNKPTVTQIFEAGKTYYFSLYVTLVSNKLILKSTDLEQAEKFIIGCRDASKYMSAN